MSITKAFLYTILIVIIYCLITVIIIIPTKYFIGTPDDFTHIYGILKIISTVGAFLIIYFFFWKPKFNIKKALKFKYYNPKVYLCLPIIAFGLILIDKPFWDFNLLLNYYQHSLDYKKPTFIFNQSAFVYSVISTLLIGPLIEELFFRKLVLGKLAERYHPSTALIISSSCFSLIHIETPNNLIPAFIGGIVLGIIYIKTKKIGYSIILHFIINAMIITFNNSEIIDVFWFYGYNFDLTYWLMFLFGISITILSVKKITSYK